MKIAILGFSREGRALFSFLKKKHPKDHIFLLDKNSETKCPREATGVFGPDYLKDLTTYDIIYRSPGIPYTLPQIQAAKKKGVVISSATHLFFEQMRHRHPGVPILGITGSKGKSTTSTLVHRILKEDGKNALLAGNIGIPALDVLKKVRAGAIVVLELSSFQLEDLPYSPDIAAVTEMFPEHQDAHGSLRAYYNAKTSIARHQKKSDAIFYFPGNAVSKKIALLSPAEKIAVDEKKFTLFAPGDLKIKGRHNFKNAVMAALIARRAGASESSIVSAVSSFAGLDHRLQFVRKLKGAEFYDDSASTNPIAMVGAIKSFPDRGVVLIAGGYDKGLDYAPLTKALTKSNVRLLILFGANKKKIAESAKGTGVRTVMALNLEEAVMQAHLFCLSSPAHFAIVLSPGAASFDMFKSYADRGDQFKKLVRKLTLKPAKL